MIANFAEKSRSHWLILIWIAALCALLCVQNPALVIESNHDPNSTSQQNKPYVVLVSLDGFRYDYAERYRANHLRELGAQGASAPEGMIPVYPSVTFPNHYSIVTGLYPEHHGIVAMSFYDPSRKQKYAFNDAQSDSDGSWYGGVPIWSLAEERHRQNSAERSVE